MGNKKIYKGVLAEVWEPGKIAKVIVKATDDEIAELKRDINKEVEISVKE
jgi:hypothetical protein